MVILDAYGKIPCICISNKLKLYIANLPDDWKEELFYELKMIAQIQAMKQEGLGIRYSSGIQILYHKVFPNDPIPSVFQDMHFHNLVENMVYLYFNYDYDDMPLGGWDSNCFDGRFCEGDYAEKIIDFMVFLSYDLVATPFPFPTPQWVYSSDHNEINPHRMFWGGNKVEDYISSLKEWGRLFDEFLAGEAEYNQFDYLCNALHQDNNHDAYHFVKLYTLCQMFLEKEHEYELDWKLPFFLDSRYNDDEKKSIAALLRKIRNKIAHGDFSGFDQLIETYAKQVLDNHYSFDYSEYSRKNWVILNICCTLEDSLRKILYLFFTNKDELTRIKLIDTDKY